MFQEPGAMDYTKIVEAALGFAGIFVTAIAGLLTGSLAYIAKGWWDGRKERAELKKSSPRYDFSESEAPEGWARVYSRARYLIESKRIQRVLFLVATSNGNNPSSMSVFYSECSPEIKPKFNPVDRYKNIDADNYYELMLEDLDTEIVWLNGDDRVRYDTGKEIQSVRKSRH